MATAQTGRCLARSASKADKLAIFDLPHFLCPTLLQSRSTLVRHTIRRPLRSSSQQAHLRCLHIQSVDAPSSAANPPPALVLPQQCGGCGALSQSSDPTEPGFYTLTRKSVQSHLHNESRTSAQSRKIEEEALEAAAGTVDSSILDALKSLDVSPRAPSPPPVCDRCHQLRHHHTGVSIQQIGRAHV